MSDLHESIKARAYQLWHEQGCQDGHDMDYWLQAESEVMAGVPAGAVKPKAAKTAKPKAAKPAEGAAAAAKAPAKRRAPPKAKLPAKA